MPRKVFDKIVETGFIADQKTVAKDLSIGAKELNLDEGNILLNGTKLVNFNRCIYASAIINVMLNEIKELNTTIDVFLLSKSEHDSLERNVKAIVHSTLCERCSFALMDLQNHLDSNGNYKE